MDWLKAHRTPLYGLAIAFFAVVSFLYARQGDVLGAAIFVALGALQVSFLVSAIREDRGA